MRKIDFLKTSLKCGVLSSNLLNCSAMEEKNNINNIKISNINNEEKENLQNEITERLKDEYIEEQALKIIERFSKFKKDPEIFKKFLNPDEYPNSSDIKDNFNKLKNKVIKKIEEKRIKEEKEKKNNVNKNEIIISNNEEDKKTNLKDFFIKKYFTGYEQGFSHFLIDCIAKYINQGYIFHLFEYNFDLLNRFYDISEDKYNYFNKFVVTVTVFYYDDEKVINNDYKGKVNVEKISEDKNSKLKTVKIIAKKDCLKKLFYGSHIENVLEIRNYFDKYDKVGLDLEKFFCDCLYLKNINFKEFNTENVINMAYMFHNCFNLEKLDLSCFNTNRVTNMTYMFHSCSDLEKLDLENFNTVNVKYFDGMFKNCEKLKNLNIKHFNSKNAKTCSMMFSGCKNLTELNLENFDFSNISSAPYMFEDCIKLEKVIIGKEENKTEDKTEKSSISYNKTKTINLINMYSNCESLENLELYIRKNLNIIKDGMYNNCKILRNENFKTNRVDLRLCLIDENLKKAYIKNKINI